MDKVTFIEIENEMGVTTHAIIETEDGRQISMLKSTWEELEAQKELSGTL